MFRFISLAAYIIGLFATCGAIFSIPTFAAELNEAHFQQRFCAGMRLEVSLGPQRRADCITPTHAIEVDWADKWKQGIGQSMAYAAKTGLLPGVILVCRGEVSDCLLSSLFTRQTFSQMGVAATVWECLPSDVSLEDCVVRETTR